MFAPVPTPARQEMLTNLPRSWVGLIASTAALLAVLPTEFVATHV
jgi:hypothetical protein